jgi:polysaccharide export outer membrane protein
MDEIGERSFEIRADGTITLPTLGEIKAGGLTVPELESALVEKLKKYIREPRVVVNIVRLRPEPIFVEGDFRNPGIYPLQTHKMLNDVLTAAGGLQLDASHTLKVTRLVEWGPIPLPNVLRDPDGKTTSVLINIARLRDNPNAQENISLKPYDRIAVSRAEMVYVLGDVGRQGPIEIGDREALSVLQVLSLSGGPGHDAKLRRAVILRPTANANRRTEIPLDLRRVLLTEADDLPLLPNDILYIPGGSTALQKWSKAALMAEPMIPTFLYLFP